MANRPLRKWRPHAAGANIQTAREAARVKFRIVLAGLLLFCASVFPAAAQSLLPSSLGDWTATSPPAQFPAAQLNQLSGVDTNILREYGIRSAGKREFSNGAKVATATVLEM